MNEKVRTLVAEIAAKRREAKNLLDSDAYSGGGFHGVNTQALRLQAEADGIEHALRGMDELA